MKMTTGLKALALATGLLSEIAYAQSSVQLYGLIDAFVGEKKALNGHSAVIAGNGGATASFFGLRGNEDIGGGTKVIFVLEGYFNVQTGVAGRPGYPSDGLFSRNAYVGLTGNYGTVTAGMIPPLLWFSTIKFNSMGNSFIFSPMVIHTYIGVNGQGVFGNGGEWWNSVYYSTPTVNGLNGKAMYSFGNDPGHLGQNKWSLQASYNTGGFATSVVYQQIKYNTIAGDLGTVLRGLTTQSLVNVGATYDVGMVKLFGQYQHIWDSVTTGDIGVNTGQLGFSVPVGIGQILGSDAYSKSSGGSSVYRNTWAISYDYPLSRRTDVYVSFLADRASKLSMGNTAGVGIRTTF